MKLIKPIIEGIESNRLLWLMLLGFALFPLITAWVDLPFWNDVAMRIMILAMAAMGLNLVLGYGGLISFGHAAFIGVGAYTVAISSYYEIENGWLHLLLGLGVTGILGIVIGFLSLRTSGLYFIMITLAFAQMLYFFFVSLEAYGGDDGIIIDRADFAPLDLYAPFSLYFLIWLGLVLVSLLLMLVVRSRFGVVLRATRSNASRVEASGLSPFRFRLVAYVLSAMICGVAGVFFANWQEYVSPAIMHWSRSGELMIIIVLGGLGRLAGPLIGAVAFLLLEEFLPEIIGSLAPSYGENWMIIFGPLLLLIVLFARGGLLGLADKFIGERRL